MSVSQPEPEKVIEAEVTVDTEILEDLEDQVKELQVDLSGGGVCLSSEQEAKMRALLDKAIKALVRVQKIVEDAM